LCQRVLRASRAQDRTARQQYVSSPCYFLGLVSGEASGSACCKAIVPLLLVHPHLIGDPIISTHDSQSALRPTLPAHRSRQEPRRRALIAGLTTSPPPAASSCLGTDSLSNVPSGSSRTVS